MRAISSYVCAGALGLAFVLLTGCGSQTKTVSVASAPPGQTTATTPTTPAKTSSAPTPAPTTGATTTRTAPEPAFAEQETKAEGVSAAAAVVKAKGYTPNSSAEYHANQTLRVLVGTRTGSGDGYGQQAFFFLGGRYLGTDAKEPSAKLRVVSQGDTEVAIAYPLYRHADPLCCPGGGTKVVHFALNNGKLTALDTIPPASSASGLGRN
jgi:hypothetical protein